jgi:hypothetical protein
LKFHLFCDFYHPYFLKYLFVIQLLLAAAAAAAAAAVAVVIIVFFSISLLSILMGFVGLWKIIQLLKKDPIPSLSVSYFS